jgi:hypothetical protein
MSYRRGHRYEKKEKKKKKKKKKGNGFMVDLENSNLIDGSSKDEIDDFEEEMDRKAFEKRRVIQELTPKERKRSELDEDLMIARVIILEEGIDKQHELEVANKRKEVTKRTSSPACKVIDTTMFYSAL